MARRARACLHALRTICPLVRRAFVVYRSPVAGLSGAQQRFGDGRYEIFCRQSSRKRRTFDCDLPLHFSRLHALSASFNI